MKNNLKAIKNFILDLIYPKACIGCGGEGKYLCNHCLAQIQLTPNFYCALCHRPSDWAMICPSCRQETSLKAIWVSADYNNKILQDLIHNLKYNYLEEIGDDLAKLVVKYLQSQNILNQFDINSDNAILIPVPLHKKRFLSRGFNQSDLLASRIDTLLGIGKIDYLQRVRNTETQINLKRSERQENVKAAFCLADKNLDKNKKIILIDDVVTTGSTLKECVDVLSKAGYTEIYGLVVAQRED